MPMNKTVSRLLGLEIDEVSSVDRPANQHGLVLITKRDEDTMAGSGLYDATGAEYDESELEAGMTVLDAEGQERILLSDADLAELEAQGYDLNDLEVPDDASELYEDQPTLATVGKAGGAAITGGKNTAIAAGRSVKTRLLGLRDEAGSGYRAGRMVNGRSEGSSAHVVGNHLGRNRDTYVVGAAAGTTGAAAGNRRGRVRKSVGQELLQELSKAYTDSDRDRVIAKAFGAVDDAERRAEQAYEIAKALEERAEVSQYVELAKSYELPVDPDDLGPILHTIAKSGLSDAQLDVVDRIFQAAGELLYQETGFAGRGDSPIMEAVQGTAYDVVGKADVTPEQAMVAVFEANPDAYLEYLAEQR